MAALGLGVQVGIALPYGRTQESEADRLGLELMARAGFNPAEAVTLWQNMSAASGGKAPPQLLSTHPSDQNRIASCRPSRPKCSPCTSRRKHRAGSPVQGISLRLARPADAAAMTVMQRASWLAAYGEVLGADMLAQLAVTDHLQIWRRRLAEPGPAHAGLSGRGGHRPALLAALLRKVMTARIRALYLHPDHWRQGHGKRLWQAVAVQMRRAGCECVRLWLLDGNHIGEDSTCAAASCLTVRSAP
jgi:GNAT superfamily N-acetyltransferase